jgi:DNA-binding CsgD family transcriptional regulator
VTALEIVGRDEELAVVTGFLADEDSLPRVLLIEGEPGIGKTTVWRQVLEEGRAAGYRVLTTRPGRSEAQLAFAGLTDLFEESLDDVLPALPPPQARALRVALLLEEAEPVPIDPRAIAAAVLGSIRLLARRGPLLIAVDDSQWLDPASAAALGFALRRLNGQPVAIVITIRAGHRVPPVSGDDEDRTERLKLAPLSLGSLHRVLVSRLGLALPRPALRRVVEVSGGNPFFALELGRALGDRVPPSSQEPLPVPDSLTKLLGGRLAALSEETREALLVTALAAEPTLQLVTDALGVDAWERLRPAVEHEVVSFVGDRPQFSHPLLASAVEVEADLGLRRRAHARLAAVAADPVARARHLALASPAPDERVARDLAGAAARARSRGAVLAAAELGELAARSTPSGVLNGQRRLLQAARDYLASADPQRAKALARKLLATAPQGVKHAETLAFLGELDLETGRVATGIERLEEALEDARGVAELELSIHQALARVVRFETGVAEAERHVLRSVELAEKLGDPVLRSRALAAMAVFRRSVIGADAREAAERAVTLALESGDPGALDGARIALGDVLTWTGHFQTARSVLTELSESARDRDEVVAGGAVWYLSLLEFYAGRWDEAHAYAERCREIGSQYALDEGDAAGALWPAVLLASHRDDPAAARPLAQRGLALAESTRHAMHTVTHRAALGILDFRDGDDRAAVEHFHATEELRQASERLLEPNMRFYYPDYVESLLRLGRIEDATGLLDPWAADAERLGRDWALAHATRCRGLVAAARGDVPSALALLEEAFESTAGGPYATARAALALGVVRLRARQKRAAREALEDARACFESLGARGWAERASRELGRVGGRAPAGSRLTPAQRRVAELVAEGLTTKEVAARLFVSPRTVDGHLAEIYAKLGVHSRTALAHRLNGNARQ